MSSRFFSQSTTAGAYLTGPAIVNPALLGYGTAVLPATPSLRPYAFAKPTTTPEAETEISDAEVAAAIERLTKPPASTPEALQQAALDMELVIRHFDALSSAFGAEAALTSLALDLAAMPEARYTTSDATSKRRTRRRTASKKSLETV